MTTVFPAVIPPSFTHLAFHWDLLPFSLLLKCNKINKR